jgi:hypothetical protein
MKKSVLGNFFLYLISRGTIIVLLSLIGLTLLAKLYFPCCHNFEENILASSVVVLIVEILVYLRNFFKLRILKGNKYKRTKITNRLEAQVGDSIYEDITQRYIDGNVSTEITLKYLGGGKYLGDVEYEEGKAKFYLVFDRVNPTIGTGTFQYIFKKPGLGELDMGKYEIQIDVLNNDIVYLFYSNSIPSGLTSGYEIWEGVKR